MSNHFWHRFAVAAMVLVVLVLSLVIYPMATQPGGWDGCQWIEGREGLGGFSRPGRCE